MKNWKCCSRCGRSPATLSMRTSCAANMPKASSSASRCPVTGRKTAWRRNRQPRPTSRSNCSSTTGDGLASRSSFEQASGFRSGRAKSRSISRMCRRSFSMPIPHGRLDPNVLSIRIQPDEGFALTIQLENPWPEGPPLSGPDGFSVREHVRRVVARSVRDGCCSTSWPAIRPCSCAGIRSRLRGGSSCPSWIVGPHRRFRPHVSGRVVGAGGSRRAHRSRQDGNGARCSPARLARVLARGSRRRPHGTLARGRLAGSERRARGDGEPRRVSFS